MSENTAIRERVKDVLLLLGHPKRQQQAAATIVSRLRSDRGLQAQVAMFGLIIAAFVAIWVGAISIITAEPVQDSAATYDSSASSDSPSTAITIAAALALSFTALLAVIRLGLDRLLYVFYLFVFGNLTTAYVMLVTNTSTGAMVAVEVSLLVGTMLAIHYVRRWWVTAVVGVAAATVGTAILGVWLDVKVVLLLFAILAVLDTVAVLYSGHMLTVVDGMADNLPIAIQGPIAFEERRPLLGLGDLVVPSVLVISALQVDVFPSVPVGIGTIHAGALGAAVGILIGVVVSQYQVYHRGAQPGLPYLCGGAAVGYLAAAVMTGAELATVVGV